MFVNPFVFIAIVILSMIIFASSGFYIMHKKENLRYYSPWALITCWGSLIVLILAIALFSVDSYLIVDGKDDEVKTQPLRVEVGAVYFKFSHWFGFTDTILPLNGFTHIEMQGPSAITDNPKVRDITYEVSLSLSDNLKDYNQYKEKVLSRGGIDNFLEYWSYEFNEKKSKQISKFYNPVAEKQQSEFKKLVREFFEPKLKGTGYKIKDASFSLNTKNAEK